MSNLLDKIKTKLDQAGVKYELIPLPEDLPLDVESHMKFHGREMKFAMPNMVFKTEKGLIVAQRRADTQIDNAKLRKVLGVQRLSLAEREDLEKHGLKPGIVPPFGYDIPVYMDKKVLENSEIYTGTGDKQFGLKLDPNDLVKVNNAIIDDFTTSGRSGGPKRVLSGIQPSGNLHLGNYLGAIKRWVAEQDEKENFFCIVDLHAITVPQDPIQLKKNIRELAGIYFACGLDPEKSTVFVQSDVSAHAELGWILNCFTPLGWLNRMTQFKDKAGDQKESVSAGLYDYPVLMAADILLYQADEVPVGEDQKQHVELARDIAQRFNSIYGGETLKLPNPNISKVAARIMSLDDPTKKMSKSLPSGSLNLLDDPDTLRSKIMKATTDSEGSIKFDQNRPGIYNLLEIYHTLTGEEISSIEQKFAGKGYGDFKKELAEIVVEALQPIQDKYQKYLENPQEIEEILKRGADKVRPIANQTLQNVKNKVGLGS